MINSIMIHINKLRISSSCCLSIMSSRHLFPHYSTRKNRIPNDQKSPNSFNLYIKENIKSIPNIPIPERVKLLALQWKGLSLIEKEKYMEESRRRRRETQEMFNVSSDAQKTEMIEAYKEKNLKVQKKHQKQILKKFRQDTNYPVRPLNTWSMFVKEYAEKQNERVHEVSKDARKEYQELPDEEKLKYKEHYAQNLQIQKEELKKWKEDYGSEYAELKKSFSNQETENRTTQNKENVSSGLTKRLKAAANKNVVN